MRSAWTASVGFSRCVARSTRSQNSHPHAYLTPDLQWVVFNSNRSGAAHVYAARLPEGMTGKLLS